MTVRRPTKPAIPGLPSPPMAYELKYMTVLVRAIDRLAARLAAPVVVIDDIPGSSDAYTLRPGELFEFGGYVRIIRAADIWAGGDGMTAYGGTVEAVVP